MQIAELLLDTLEDLNEPDFEKFKWYLSLNILDGYSPIPKSFLDKAIRTKTVNEMIQRYCEEPALNITLEILLKMRMKGTAQKLQSTYAEGKAAAASTPSCAPAPAPVAPVAPVAVAPTTLSAQQGSVIVAPTVTGSTAGTWNITINKT